MGLRRAGSGPAAPRPERRERDRDEADLLAQLEDPSPEARRWAARDLGDHHTAIPALVRRLGVEEAVAVREAILTTLLRFGGPAVVRELVVFLRSDDPGLRSAVIDALRQLPGETAARLDALATDPDSDVRIFALDIARQLQLPAVAALLARVVREDAHVNVVAAALEGLAELGPPAASEDVLQVKERFPGNAYLAFLADFAAGELKGP